MKRTWLYLIQDGSSRRHKIGITNNLERRLRQIQEGDPEKGVAPVPKAHYQYAVKIWFAYRNEQRLHRKWGSERFTFKGSGRTEWFKFGAEERMFVEGDFFYLKYFRLNGLIWWGWIFK